MQGWLPRVGEEAMEGTWKAFQEGYTIRSRIYVQVQESIEEAQKSVPKIASNILAFTECRRTLGYSFE